MPLSHHRPPKWARKFFHWYCHPDLKESIDGDLEERFADNVYKQGAFKARLNYCLDVIRFMNRFTLRRRNTANQPKPFMTLRNSLIHSYRFLKRHRYYTFINVTGLSLGIAATLIIALFVRQESSYDRFHEQGDRIFRINNVYTNEQGDVFSLANSSPVFAREFQQSIPGYEKTTRLRYTTRTHLSHGETSFYEDKGYYADSLFFEVLPFQLLAGDDRKALDEPNSIVITEAMALKYFDSPKPIGRFLNLNGSSPLRVTGILAPIPSNSHIDFDFLISFSTYQVPEGYASDLTSWSWAGFLTYALVTADTDIQNLTLQTNELIAAQFPPGGTSITVHLQALSDIYLGSSQFPDDLSSGLRSGSQFTVYILSIIALLILAISGFNYANLSASISLQRGKEVGIRKVLGANNYSIRWQILSDALLITLAGLILAYLLLWLGRGLPLLIDWGMAYDFSHAIRLLPFALVLIFIFSVLISIYPALLLSKTPTSSAIRNKLRSLRGGNFAKKTLVTLQFGITLVLISAALVVKDQLDFMTQQNMGIDQESLVTIQMLPEDMARHYNTLKSALEMSADIRQVTQSERLIGAPWPMNIIQLSDQANSEPWQIVGNQVGFDYLETIGSHMKSGRFFSPEVSADLTNAIVINQATADLMGLQDPLGKEVLFFSSNGPRRIIGVMEDFHFSSLHEGIAPMVLIMPFIDLKYITLRLTPGNLSQKIESIEGIWDEVTQGLPLEITFVNDHLELLYQTEQNLSSQIAYFSALAILLACLGLYGLISFNTKRRLKEVSIRKVIGASPLALSRLLTREYLMLLILAAMVSIPLSYALLDHWLDKFAYRIDLSASYFLISLLAFGAVCFATVCRHMFQVVRQNPVKHLKED